MKYNLVLLCAGNSLRFGINRPKFLLTMPSGELMAQEVIKSIKKSAQLSKIFVVVQKQHVKDHNLNNVFKIISKDINHKIELFILDKATNGPAESAYKFLSKVNLENILIKDCDNSMFFNPLNKKNFVVYQDISNLNINKPGSKSYLKINNENRLLDIVEKKVISENICAGLYAFENNKFFIKYYKKIVKGKGEIYISHVIRSAIEDNQDFWGIESTILNDYGTIDEYIDNQKKHMTIFCDIDGVIIKNQSRWFENSYNSKPELLKNNINLLLKKQKEGATIIFVTSRDESLRKITISLLKSFGFNVKNLLMNLPHSPRLIINDYSNSNPFPSALSINLKRDDDELGGKL